MFGGANKKFYLHLLFIKYQLNGCYMASREQVIFKYIVYNIIQQIKALKFSQIVRNIEENFECSNPKPSIAWFILMCIIFWSIQFETIDNAF